MFARRPFACRGATFALLALLSAGPAALPVAAQSPTSPPSDSARVSVVIAAPRPAARPPVRRAVPVDAWWGYDKAQHFVASGLVTLSAQYTYETKFGGDRRRVLPAAALTSLSVGVAKEIYDVHRPRGSGFSQRDLVWDALGTAAAVVFVLL